MAAIPRRLDPTLEAVDVAIEAAQPAWKPRGYLGMSALGDPCERKLWYGFRWSSVPNIPARGLKAIADGHRGEQLQSIRLRLVDGLTLHTHDPNTHEQFGVTDVGGHVAGHMDGAIVGLIQAPKTWHVWEHKQVNESKQAKLVKLAAELGEKAALEQWDPVYHAQAVLYMEYTGMTRHYLTCASPGGRHTVGVRTNADAGAAAKLKAKASRIVAAPAPLSRIAESAEYYWCKWCEHAGVCREDKLPPPTCRSCCHATPEMDGDARWSCARKKIDLSRDAQFSGCEDHLYLPSFVTFAQQVDASAANNSITYVLSDGRRFHNGPPGNDSFASGELYAAAGDIAEVMKDANIAAIRQMFDASISKMEAA